MRDVARHKGQRDMWSGSGDLVADEELFEQVPLALDASGMFVPAGYVLESIHSGR